MTSAQERNSNFHNVPINVADGNKEPLRNDVKGVINRGEEEEMEIIGFKKSKPLTVLTWSFFFLTAGLLRLVFHWWPHYLLYCTHKRCTLREATKVLIIDVYEQRFKSLFVKDVKTIKLNDGRSFRNEPGADSQLNHGASVKVHLVDGSIQDVDEVRLLNVKKVKYIWVNEKQEFVRLVGLDNGRSKADLLSLPGCSKEEQMLRQKIYGKNIIDVPIQSIMTLIVLEVLNPFYIFQVFSLAVWFSENYYYYGVAIFVMSFFGISASVIQTHRNQNNLYKTINQVDKVTVRRLNGNFEEIETSEVVPGDVIAVPSEGTACCDALLLNGTCIVNESMLTGESVPVTKTSAKRTPLPLNAKEDSNHILFCGTQVLQTRGNETTEKGENGVVLALVLQTGFLTSKGSLVQSILYPPPADFKFDTDSYKFIWIMAFMGFSGLVFSIYHKAGRGLSIFEIGIKSLDLLTIAIPVALPASMTVGKIFALERLKKEMISCINSRVVNVSGSINCICFDKTGTLTEDGLDVWGVLPTNGGGELEQPVDDPSELPMDEDHRLLYGMATCHSLSVIDSDVVGDPLDLKMFESTKWLLSPEKNGSVTVTSPGIDKNVKQLVILHQFQFSSKLQRMSVVVKDCNTDELFLFVKGSPEAIVSLCQPMTVPEKTMARLKDYTAHGYRVIAMAWKPLTEPQFQIAVHSPRDDVERDLRFAGLIILENRLKDLTIRTIDTLKEAELKVVMITGDNIQTAISVAKECGILHFDRKMVEIDIDETGHLIWSNVGNQSINIECKKNEIEAIIRTSRASGYQLAVSGKAWAKLRETKMSLVPRLVDCAAVFGRMTSDQKQQVIVELQNLGYIVAMCGDGANDCGALKTANVGISLSEAEASVASPFTSQERNISCVLNVIREGRAALTTSFGTFKFMILYSFTEFYSTLLLYSNETNLTDFEFLFIDVFLIVNFAFFFGRARAYRGPLVAQRPQDTLLSPIPIISMLLQSAVVVIFQTVSLLLVRQFSWFEPFKYSSPDYYVSYENYSVYALSQFQYIALAVVFSQGHPFRERIHTNTTFFFSIILMTAICVYVTIAPADWVIDLMELRFPPSSEFPWLVVLLGAVNFLISLFCEKFIVNYVLERHLKRLVPSLARFKLISSSP